jgi:signal transduction histidine kinase
MSAPLAPPPADQTDPIASAGKAAPSFQHSFQQVLLINAGATICFPVVTGLLLVDQVPRDWLVGWLLLHALSASIVVTDWFIRRHLSGDIPPRWQVPLELAVAGFAGSIWGLSALAMPLLDADGRLLLIAVIAGVIGGSAPALALMPLAGVIFIGCIAAPFALHFLSLGTTLGYGMAGLLAAYVAAMVVANQLLNGILVRNWRLVRENSDLYAGIRRARNELLDIADSSEAFVFIDPDRRIQLWNRRLPALLGLAEGDLQRDAALPPALEQAGLPADLIDRLETASVGQSRPVLALPNGRWVRAGLRRLPDGDAALILVDVTEQQQQNARLEELFREVSQARDSALRASQAKSSFLANMSHELRTPLNAIIGFAEIIQRKLFGPDWTRYDEYVDDIHSSGKHLLGIINDILDLARIEANQITLEEDTVDVAEEAATCIRLAARQFDRPAGSLVAQIPADLPPLYADARLLRQILINLIANALKFSPADVPVEIGARLEPESRELVLWVRDRGIGIAPKDQARIFDPFEQANTQMSRNFGGVGLGLSLVRAFVLAHQGRIGIDSAVGQGTTITVHFPASRTGTA